MQTSTSTEEQSIVARQISHSTDEIGRIASETVDIAHDVQVKCNIIKELKKKNCS